MTAASIRLFLEGLKSRGWTARIGMREEEDFGRPKGG